MIPAPELLLLALLPFLAAGTALLFRQRWERSTLLNGMLVIAALEFTVSLWALRRMFFAGGFHDISFGAPAGGILQFSSGLSWALLEMSAFECLTFSGVSLGAFLLFAWQRVGPEPTSAAAVAKQTFLWVILSLIFLVSTPLQCACLLSLGALMTSWVFEQKDAPNVTPSPLLFVQLRMGDIAWLVAAFMLYLAFGSNNPHVWVTQTAQLSLKPLETGFFKGRYVDQIFEWVSWLIILGAFSRQGFFVGARALKNHLLAEDSCTRVFSRWVLWGGCLIFLRKTQLTHVLMPWNIHWALLAMGALAIFHAYQLFRATNWRDADHWTFAAFFSLTCVANVPYDGTAGFLQTLLFFWVLPFFAVTQLSVLHATGGEHRLGALGGLWKKMRRQEQIRTLLTFSLCPLLGSWTFYGSFMWADWAIRPFFHVAMAVPLILFSFFLTAGAFKTVFQVFAGPERDNTNIQPPSFAQNLLLGVMSLLALATAIAPNILSMPVHRLTALFDAAYAPFLAWVEPEIRTALFLLTQFQPSLDVLAGPQEQWILYGLIWGATLAGWLFAYLNFGRTPNDPDAPKTRIRQWMERERSELPSDPVLYNAVELMVLRVTFLARRVFQPLIAGGALWHIWRAPSSFLRFALWLFHNGESRRTLSVCLLLVGFSVFWWSRAL